MNRSLATLKTLEHVSGDIQPSPRQLKFLLRRFSRVASPSLRAFPKQGGDRPRGNGSNSIRNQCRLLNRVLFWGCLVFLVCSGCCFVCFCILICLHDVFFFSFLFSRFRGIPSSFFLACPFWLELKVIYLFSRWSSGNPKCY